MIKIITKGWLLLLLSFFLLLFNACSGQKGKIYTKGKIWNYLCVFYNPDGEVEDSFHIDLKVQSNLVALLARQISVIYEYPDGTEETTGAIEEETTVSIHQPQSGKFNFTHMLPMPTVHYPLSHKTESTIETKIGKSTFPELNGKTVKQATRSLAADSIMYKGQLIPCYAYEAANTSLVEELGQYRLKYWFHSEYGFVRYLYTKPDGSTVAINLVDIMEE